MSQRLPVKQFSGNWRVAQESWPYWAVFNCADFTKVRLLFDYKKLAAWLFVGLSSPLGIDASPLFPSREKEKSISVGLLVQKTYRTSKNAKQCWGLFC